MSQTINEKIIDEFGSGTVLCALSELTDPDSRGFQVPSKGRIFIVRFGEKVSGYVNICPHRTTPLDWKHHQFLTVEKDAIMCATHGALFTISDGVCFRGPCRGLKLEPVPIGIKSGLVTLA